LVIPPGIPFTGRNPRVRKYRLVREHLREGQRITLVYQGEFGGVTAV
jgi:hypothetical protein